MPAVQPIPLPFVSADPLGAAEWFATPDSYPGVRVSYTVNLSQPSAHPVTVPFEVVERLHDPQLADLSLESRVRMREAYTILGGGGELTFGPGVTSVEAVVETVAASIDQWESVVFDLFLGRPTYAAFEEGTFAVSANWHLPFPLTGPAAPVVGWYALAPEYHPDPDDPSLWRVPVTHLGIEVRDHSYLDPADLGLSAPWAVFRGGVFQGLELFGDGPSGGVVVSPPLGPTDFWHRPSGTRVTGGVSYPWSGVPAAVAWPAGVELTGDIRADVLPQPDGRRDVTEGETFRVRVSWPDMGNTDIGGSLGPVAVPSWGGAHQRVGGVPTGGPWAMSQPYMAGLANWDDVSPSHPGHTVRMAGSGGSVDLDVSAVADGEVEPTELLAIGIGPYYDTVRLYDTPVVTVGTVRPEAFEGRPDDPGLVWVSRVGGDQSQPLDAWVRVDGSAEVGVDYTLSGAAWDDDWGAYKVRFAAGQAAAVLKMTPVDDRDYTEADYETVVVTPVTPPPELAGTYVGVGGPAPPAAPPPAAPPQPVPVGPPVVVVIADQKHDPIVYLSGDFAAAEVSPVAGGDPIGVVFHRKTDDPSQPLRVWFEVVWGTAKAADFDPALGGSLPVSTNDPGQTLVYDPQTGKGSVVIPAGQRQSAPVAFRAAQDNVREPVEQFSIAITADQSNLPAAKKYLATDVIEELAGLPGSAIRRTPTATLHVADAFALFASANNAKPELNDRTTHGPDVSDIRQGGSADCYLLSAAGPYAHMKPAEFAARFTQNGGDVSRTFYADVKDTNGNVTGVRPVVVTTPLTYTAGSEFAGLSGDLTPGNAAEIWPQVLEKLYRQFVTQQGLQYESLSGRWPAA